jgi:DNA-directed RNA polymerase I, II, and III subunit RPABC2
MSGLKEMNDEDLFMEGSDIDESDIDDSDVDAVDAVEEEDAEDANEEDAVDEVEAEDAVDEVDAVDAEDEDSANLQGGAKKKSGDEEEDTDSDSSSDSASEAGASEADPSEAGSGEELSSSGSDSDDDEDYLQKFNKSMRDDLIMNFHPESKSHNYEEIKQLAKVMRNKNGIIMDELHKTIPILTKYEKTRILGQRAKQIETGAVPLVQVPPNIIDSYLIAKLELAQNKIPFIIRRPLPNGGMEYWYVSDLENL